MLKYSRQELLGAVAQAHLQIGGPVEEIVALAEETGAGLILLGSRGLGGLGGPNGQRFRIRRPPRPLPGFGGSRCPARVASEEDRTDVWRSLSKQSGAPAVQQHHS